MNTADIKIDRSNNHVVIEAGKDKTISGHIIGISPDGQIYAAYDFGQEDAEQLVLFTEHEILYCRRFEGEYIDFCRVCNDGAVLLYADEDLIVLDPDGKQKVKRHVGIYYDSDACEINAKEAYFCGESEDDDSVSFYYIDLATMASWQKEIKNITYINQEGNEDTLSASDIRVVKTSDAFVLLYDKYITATALDFNGNDKKLSPNERVRAISLFGHAQHSSENGPSLPIPQNPRKTARSGSEKEQWTAAPYIRQKAQAARPDLVMGMILIVCGIFFILCGIILSKVAVFYIVFVFIGTLFIFKGVRKRQPR